MRNDNLKRTGQLRNVRVESGFVTVCSVDYSDISYAMVTVMMDRAQEIVNFICFDFLRMARGNQQRVLQNTQAPPGGQK